MTRIQLIWIGKTRERCIREGLDDYLGRLKGYAELSITELRDERGSDAGRIVEKEGERILKLRTPYVLLDEKGRQMSSPEFARFIERGGAVQSFVLGGAYGVSERVKTQARSTISLSSMTLTHEMARLFFVEQLYRAYTIIHKRGYHH